MVRPEHFFRSSLARDFEGTCRQAAQNRGKQHKYVTYHRVQASGAVMVGVRGVRKWWESRDISSVRRECFFNPLLFVGEFVSEIRASDTIRYTYRRLRVLGCSDSRCGTREGVRKRQARRGSSPFF